MGATFYFDEMLPPPPKKQVQMREEDGHQLEVFTHGGKLWIRIRPAGDRDGSENEYTGELSLGTWRRLREAIERSGFNMGFEP